MDNAQFVDENTKEEKQEKKVDHVIKKQSSLLDNRTRENREIKEKGANKRKSKK